MKLHFLDVGTEQYGDCILIEHGTRFILVDGGHAGNYRAQGATPSIPDQLSRLMGPAPFMPDLLVVTHMHGDHVGCLPRMVTERVLLPKKILAADERWGAGIVADFDAEPLAGADAGLRLIAEAMQEEGAGDIANEEEARAFIDGFSSAEALYKPMLESFPADRVLRYGRDSVAALEKEFKAFGLKFLGPTENHLKLCAAFIGREQKAAIDYAGRDVDDASGDDLGARFWAILKARRLQADAAAVDKAGPGSGKNNQSIVFTVGSGGKKALLAGDMQFALPEVPGLRDSMKALFQTVVDHGPYQLVKTTHHTSYNGLGADELDALGGDPILIHTGGLYDSAHPAPTVLKMLASRLAPGRFARTDRNGLVSVDLGGPQPVVTLTRGSWNNFEQNSRPPASAKPRKPDEPGAPSPARVTVSEGQGDTIEIIARVPHRATRVTITIDVQPGQDAAPPAEPAKKKSPDLRG